MPDEDNVNKPEKEAPFNCGPISGRDEIVFTCERPGAKKKNDTPGGTPQEEIDEWLEFMKGQDVKRVVCLLDDNELEFYAKPLFEIYEENGFSYIHAPMKSDGVVEKITQFYMEAEEASEKVVTHCTGGKGRAARAASSWLVKKYELSPEDACKEALETAKEKDLTRMVDAEKLRKWMGLPKED